MQSSFKFMCTIKLLTTNFLKMNKSNIYNLPKEELDLLLIINYQLFWHIFMFYYYRAIKVNMFI